MYLVGNVLQWNSCSERFLCISTSRAVQPKHVQTFWTDRWGEPKERDKVSKRCWPNLYCGPGPGVCTYIPVRGQIKGTGSHCKCDTALRAKRRACIFLWCLIHALVAGHVHLFDVWYMPWHCCINIQITGKFPSYINKCIDMHEQKSHIILYTSNSIAIAEPS